MLLLSSQNIKQAKRGNITFEKLADTDINASMSLCIDNMQVLGLTMAQHGFSAVSAFDDGMLGLRLRYGKEGSCARANTRRDVWYKYWAL